MTSGTPAQVGALREAIKWLGVMGCHGWADPAAAELDALAHRVEQLEAALRQQVRYVTRLLERDGASAEAVDYYTANARAALSGVSP